MENKKQVSISVVLCTKNRQEDLLRCIKSISLNNIKADKNYEILIIDDGDLDKIAIELIGEHLKGKYIFRYLKKNNNPGLYASRLIGINEADGDIILFLDDDTELYPDYLRILEEIYNDKTIAGAGGIDVLQSKSNLLNNLWYNIFFAGSLRKGKLSLSKFSGNARHWPYYNEEFYSEYLIGHNMSYRKENLKSILKYNFEFLKGYSIAEDLFISHAVHKTGHLIVTPQLKVKHYVSSSARDNNFNVSKSLVINHFRYLQLHNAGIGNYVAFIWTIIGHILRAIIRTIAKSNNLTEAKGYLAGLKELWHEVIVNRLKTAPVLNS